MKTSIPPNSKWATQSMTLNTKRNLKEDRDNLGKPITQDEMLQALKGIQNDKIPGLDGFPAEFYQFFWQDIKNY